MHRWRAALALAVARRGDVLVLGRVQVGRRVAEHEALLLEAGEARAVGRLDVDDRVLRQVGAHLLRVRVRVKVGAEVHVRVREVGAHRAVEADHEGARRRVVRDRLPADDLQRSRGVL